MNVPLGLPPGADSVRGFLVSRQNKKSFACFGFARHSIIHHRHRSKRRHSKRQFLERRPASGSQTRRMFFPRSMTCREGPSYYLSVHGLKYALATLVQGLASALRHQFFEHASHRFYSIHQMIQLRKLSLGERSPAFRSARDVAETKEQVSDFSQCKTELARTLDDCQAVKHCGIITPLPTEPLCRRKQANPLIIANRRGPKSNLPCHLRNG